MIPGKSPSSAAAVARGADGGGRDPEADAGGVPREVQGPLVTQVGGSTPLDSGSLGDIREEGRAIVGRDACQKGSRDAH